MNLTTRYVGNSVPTGDIPQVATGTVVVPFEQYEVVLRVADSGALIGVQEIRVNKHFLAPSQIGSIDLDDYYRE